MDSQEFFLLLVAVLPTHDTSLPAHHEQPGGRLDVVTRSGHGCSETARGGGGVADPLVPDELTYLASLEDLEDRECPA